MAIFFVQEYEFYYLQSRYYNPELGRFLNADSLASTGQGILGNNMFSYCNNNPVNYADPAGTTYHNAVQPWLCTCPMCYISSNNTTSQNSKYGNMQAYDGATYNYYGDGYIFNFSSIPSDDSTYNFYGDGYTFNYGVGKDSDKPAPSTSQISWDEIGNKAAKILDIKARIEKYGSYACQIAAMSTSATGVGPVALGAVALKLSINASIHSELSDYIYKKVGKNEQ